MGVTIAPARFFTQAIGGLFRRRWRLNLCIMHQAAGIKGQQASMVACLTLP
jgi:hypothetical protein